jgi:hypothetical protein
MTETPEWRAVGGEVVECVRCGDQYATAFLGMGHRCAPRSPTMPDTLSRRADELAVDILQACADRQAVLGLIHRYGDARVAAHIDALTAAVEAFLAAYDTDAGAGFEHVDAMRAILNGEHR